MPRKPSTKGAKKDMASPKFKRNVVPDRVDLRDRVYLPPVDVIPDSALQPDMQIPVLNQESTNACTGFALASVVYWLQRKAGRPKGQLMVSPFMLYSMARRYDEFPGDPKADTGSSLRGAMKGWYKHGVCRASLWSGEQMPAPLNPNAGGDWWLDAVTCPLGAYYRIDTRSVTDMHVALNEVGILYASAICHAGWDAVPGGKAGKLPVIQARKPKASDGGHAFVIIGYNREGFILQNSWGTVWGKSGRAILSYEDWLDNAMDCWVAQLGVVTEQRLQVATSKTLRMQQGKVRLASEASLRRHEITPFIIDLENNGRLSNTGDFRTQESDVKALANEYVGIARTEWKLKAGDPIDIAIYAHGGLNSEAVAAKTAEKWIPALYENRILPIFIMWETDLWSTLEHALGDILARQPRPAGGVFDFAGRWWNERLEKLLAKPGSAIWAEMKENAEQVSLNPEGGGRILYNACKASPYFNDPAKVRLHLIGHSAGAVLHSHVIDLLCGLGWTFETVSFMAPAVRMDTFTQKVLPHLKDERVRRYQQFHLTDEMEQRDPTCKPILGYSRSLLYLVSRSFENGQETPILGMEKTYERSGVIKGLSNVKAWTAPGTATQSTTHGGFDDDRETRNSVIASIKHQKII